MCATSTWVKNEEYAKSVRTTVFKGDILQVQHYTKTLLLGVPRNKRNVNSMHRNHTWNLKAYQQWKFMSLCVRVLDETVVWLFH